jgi:molybdate transport system ATP-binding protein
LAEPLTPFATVRLHHRIGPLEIDVDFKLTQPWTILFGASGSGKTTILRAMAGLLRPDEAHITTSAFGQPVVAVNTMTKTFVPAHQRSTRLAAQQTALFPHMTVRENIAFGARRTTDGATAEEMVDMAIDRFRLGGLVGLVPAMLSGGERQRVAIARATVSAVSLSGGSILLLDEPFTGMDARLRDSLVEDLQRSLAVFKVPVLSVTHDVAEAFLLGAEVIKVADGKVVAQGSAEVVLAEERERLLTHLSGFTSAGRYAGDAQEGSTEPYLGG